MQEFTVSAAGVPVAIVEEAWQEVGASFERFCLTAGIATLAHTACWPRPRDAVVPFASAARDRTIASGVLQTLSARLRGGEGERAEGGSDAGRGGRARHLALVCLGRSHRRREPCVRPLRRRRQRHDRSAAASGRGAAQPGSRSSRFA